ncbi:MAG TPA: helix-turn-helix transcriptional regulator [Polyangiaceae bacterium]|nr:helix-turn-helix transcriptional regulator [Polyangiaceae bacterium]
MKRPSRESLAEIPEIDVAKAKILGRGLRSHRRLALRSLRAALGKTQLDVARAAEMDQGDVSKLESRSDMHVSTLSRYARALGGKLEVAVVVDGRRYLIDV